MSIYTTPFRRFTLRTDGFASVHVGDAVGEVVTRPLYFKGRELTINYATSAGGSLRVEVQDGNGQPYPGFALADCRNVVGDTIDQVLSWAPASRLEPLVGRPIRLRFVMQEADLFSFQFR